MSTKAIAAEHHFDNWTTENGLPHNSVRWLIQTRDGYLWASTGSGLTRFDGLHFSVFTSNNTPGILSDRYSLFALIETRDGAIWAGTRDSGVVRYKDGVFTTLTSKNGLLDDEVLRVDDDEQGTLWVFTSKGVAKWRGDRFVPADGREFRKAARDPERLGDDSRYMGLWRMTEKSFERFAHGKWSPLPLPPHVASPKDLKIASIFEDGLGRLWYSLRRGVGEYYCVRNGVLEIYRIPESLFVCYKDRDGALWVSDHEAHTATLKDGKREPTAGLATPTVMRVLEDRDGAIWVATLNEGLFRRRPLVAKSAPHPSGPEVVATFAEDHSGQVWIGGVGLVKYAPDHSRTFQRRPGRFGPNTVTALALDVDGGLWVGFQEGVARFVQERFIEQPQLNAVLKRRVLAIHRARNGDLWIGGEDGLVRLQGQRLTHFTRATGLGGDRVKTILEDRAGRIWVGMQEGLSYFDGRQLVPVQPSQHSGPLAAETLYEDAAGNVWMATDGNGLFLVSGGHVFRFTSEQGLASNNISQILEDRLGFLWLGTNTGLVRVRRQDLERLARGELAQVPSIRLGKADGVGNAHFESSGQPAALKRRTGELWFAAYGEIAMVDPAQVPVRTDPLPVHVEDCVVEGKAAPCRRGLTLEPGQRNLEIHYTAISYNRPEEIRFRYRLASLDPHWTDAGARRTAYLSRLPSGEYEFEVEASNAGGIWSRDQSHLRITVLPALYATWWFRTAAVLAAFLIMSAAYRYRMRSMEKAHATQQAFSRRLIATQENERKRIAAELHDSLGQRLMIIRNLALIQGEPAGGPWEAISNEAFAAMGEVREISYDLRPYQLDLLGLTKTVESAIRTVGVASKISFTSAIDNIDDALPPDARVNFYRIVQECLNNIVKHSEATEADIVIGCDAERLTMMVKDNGKGFTPGSNTPAPDRGGFGLLGISERAQLLRGTAEVRAAPGKGTQVIVEITLDEFRNGA